MCTVLSSRIFVLTEIILDKTVFINKAKILLDNTVFKNTQKSYWTKQYLSKHGNHTGQNCIYKNAEIILNHTVFIQTQKSYWTIQYL
jgi:hypothetical protein